MPAPSDRRWSDAYAVYEPAWWPVNGPGPMAQRRQGDEALPADRDVARRPQEPGPAARRRPTRADTDREHRAGRDGNRPGRHLQPERAARAAGPRAAGASTVCIEGPDPGRAGAEAGADRAGCTRRARHRV